MDGIVKVVDYKETIEIPYRDGERLSEILQREIEFFVPCGGGGTCGRCVVDIEKNDGTISKQLGCQYRVHEPLTVKMFTIHRKK